MREVIKRDRVRVGEAQTIRSAGCGDGAGTPAQSPPGVRLVRLEGRVQAIEVTCRCGTVSIVEIELEVAAQDATEATS